jgi:hypothetical protein
VPEGRVEDGGEKGEDEDEDHEEACIVVGRYLPATRGAKFLARLTRAGRRGAPASLSFGCGEPILTTGAAP